jgi:hypothetical protein
MAAFGEIDNKIVEELSPVRFCKADIHVTHDKTTTGVLDNSLQAA